MSDQTTQRNRGFSLIQISMILLVGSLVMVTFLPNTLTDANARATTNKRMSVIMDALRQYQIHNGRLPCPAASNLAASNANYAVEAANGGAEYECVGLIPAASFSDSTNHIAIGTVPAKTLRIPTEYMIDGYGRFITYVVDTNTTGLGWSANGLQGKITVTDNGIPSITVLALISHGKNGHGAWIPNPSSTATRLNSGSADTDELLNAHINSGFAATTTLTNFVAKEPSTTFDDIIVYKMPNGDLSQLPTGAPFNINSVIAKPANGTFRSGQSLSFTIRFPVAATVVTTGGTPRIPLYIGGNVRYAAYVSGSTTTDLVFTYVVHTDSAPNGIQIGNNIELNGGTIKDASANNLGLVFPQQDLALVKTTPLYIYVTDFQTNPRLMKLDLDGNFVRTSSGYYMASPQQVGGMTQDSSNNIWMVDKTNNRVVKFNSSMVYVTTFGSYGTSSAGQFSQPHAVKVDPSGYLWVLDRVNNRVQRCDTSGTCTVPITSASGLNIPLSDIAIDAAGNVWVPDPVNNRILRYDAGTTAITSIGSLSTAALTIGAPVQFSGATGLTFDSSGNLWIADKGNSRIIKTNTSGIVLACFGSGTAATSTCTAGSTTFNQPYDVVYDGTYIWVANSVGGNLLEIDMTTGATVASTNCSSCTGGAFSLPRYINIGQ